MHLNRMILMIALKGLHLTWFLQFIFNANPSSLSSFETDEMTVTASDLGPSAIRTFGCYKMSKHSYEPPTSIAPQSLSDTPILSIAFIRKKLEQKMRPSTSCVLNIDKRMMLDLGILGLPSRRESK